MITGVIISGVLGYFFKNPMLAVLLSGAGVITILVIPLVNFLLNYYWTFQT